MKMSLFKNDQSDLINRCFDYGGNTHKRSVIIDQ